MTYDEFSEQFKEQIDCLIDTDSFGWREEDFFTSVMLDYLEEAGEAESPVVCPFREHGLQINAYELSEDYETVVLYVSMFYEEDHAQNARKEDVDAALKRGVQVFRRAAKDLYKSFEKDSDAFEFANTIHSHISDIKKLRVVALTNINYKPIRYKKTAVDDVELSFGIWDMDRLFRCISSGKMRETIEIDFKNQEGGRIQCLYSKPSLYYDAYLAIIPGTILATIYDEYGSRLLEKNVRSFLQVKGAVNKGIRDTLRNEPEMFLAYNNGISVTAESVSVEKAENGDKYITKIRDMQIVNGGQTTASIFNLTKEKDYQDRLDKVFVQMKISVVHSEEKMNEIVNRISECANTQNKIQVADFSANDPFNRRIEELSRIIWAPAVDGMKQCNWFFERARGQYAEMLNREGTPAKKRVFKETHPLFTKTDMAKYENTWNQLPFYVSEGAQKNFKRFMVAVKERGNFLPDEKYYQCLVAKAILYKRTEKIVQQQKYGGYRANIVTYTIALLSHFSAQRIDLSRIWKEQAITENLEKEIIKASRTVHDHILNTSNNSNISEYCKRKSCWESLISNEYDISQELKSEYINGDGNMVVSSSKVGTTSFNEVTEDESKLIEEIAEIPAEIWLSISKWAKDTNNLQPWQRSIAFSVGSLIRRGKKPSYKQAKQAKIIIQSAKEKGFVKE